MDFECLIEMSDYEEIETKSQTNRYWESPVCFFNSYSNYNQSKKIVQVIKIMLYFDMLVSRGSSKQKEQPEESLMLFIIIIIIIMSVHAARIHVHRVLVRLFCLLH